MRSHPTHKHHQHLLSLRKSTQKKSVELVLIRLLQPSSFVCYAVFQAFPLELIMCKGQDAQTVRHQQIVLALRQVQCTLYNIQTASAEQACPYVPDQITGCAQFPQAC